MRIPNEMEPQMLNFAEPRNVSRFRGSTAWLAPCIGSLRQGLGQALSTSFLYPSMNSAIGRNFHQEMRSCLVNREVCVLPGTGNNIQRSLVIEKVTTKLMGLGLEIQRNWVVAAALPELNGSMWWSDRSCPFPELPTSGSLALSGYLSWDKLWASFT